MGNQGEQGKALASSLEDYRHHPSLEGSDLATFQGLARIRMQALEGQAKHFQGQSDVTAFQAGSWFTLENHPLHRFDAPQDQDFVITDLDIRVENNLPDGLAAGLSRLLGRGTQGTPQSAAPFANTFRAVRRGIPILPEPIAPPHLGLLTARVVGPPGEEVHVDDYGRIKLRFMFTRLKDHPAAGAGDSDADSAWVRMMRFWSSQGFGASFHPRAGDEMLVWFVGNDPDKPVVIGCVPNGKHRPPAFSGVSSLPGDKALSGFRSQMLKGTGGNELVFDDTSRELRVRLACDHLASQLNLGYLVQPRCGGASVPLGQGFELATQGYGALRSGRGMLLSTDGGMGDQMEVASLTSQLASGLAMAQSLSDLSGSHQAETLAAQPDAQALTTSLKGTRKMGSEGQDVAALNDPILALSSPIGIISATPASQVLGAANNLYATSGQDTNLAIGKGFVVAVKQILRVLVAKAGIKLFAAKGDVGLLAHDGKLTIIGDQEVRVYAIRGDLELLAKVALTLATSGAKVELRGGNLTIEASNCFINKGGVLNVDAPATGSAELPVLPKSDMDPEKVPAFKIALQDLPGKIGQALTSVAWKIVLLGWDPVDDPNHGVQPSSLILAEQGWEETLAQGSSLGKAPLDLTDDQRKAVWHASRCHPGRVWLIHGLNVIPVTPRNWTGGDQPRADACTNY